MDFCYFFFEIASRTIFEKAIFALDWWYEVKILINWLRRTLWRAIVSLLLLLVYLFVIIGTYFCKNENLFIASKYDLYFDDNSLKIIPDAN